MKYVLIFTMFNSTVPISPGFYEVLAVGRDAEMTQLECIEKGHEMAKKILLNIPRVGWVEFECVKKEG